MKKILAIGGALFTLLGGHQASAASICNKYCDGRSALLAGTSRAGQSLALGGRTITLQIDDDDNMIWGVAQGAKVGDQIWLQRSLDGGKTWDSTRLGMIIATSRPQTPTAMYNVDDGANNKQGMIRVCALVRGVAQSACSAGDRTSWVWNHATEAATVLMTYFNTRIGLFDNGDWWTGANAMTAVINTAAMGKMTAGVSDMIQAAYQKNLDSAEGDFRNEFIDDTGWWGLAWVAAYDLTQDQRYLQLAQADADHMTTTWDNLCGGGVHWKETGATKNAIPNELYLQLTAALHNRLPGDEKYLAQAQQEWTWFKSSGMISSENLINDGLNTTTCKPAGLRYTYNQGVVLGGLVELYKATNDPTVLESARTLADASTTSTDMNRNGILDAATENSYSTTCGGDGSAFNGAYMRGLGMLNAQLTDHPYSTYLVNNMNAAYTNARDSAGHYGNYWGGPYAGTNSSCQQSALDLMNAALYQSK